MTKTTKRSATAFGKQIELQVKALMLKEGFEVFTPEVDNNGIDFVVKTPFGDYREIQVKAKAKGALFAGLFHYPRVNYWFVFYSEDLNKFWILSSADFLKEAAQNKKGKNLGKYSIQFHGTKNGKLVPSQKYQQYEATNFQRII